MTAGAAAEGFTTQLPLSPNGMAHGVHGRDATRMDFEFKPTIVRFTDDPRAAFVAGSLFRRLREAGRIVRVDLTRNTASCRDHESNARLSRKS